MIDLSRATGNSVPPPTKGGLKSPFVIEPGVKADALDILALASKHGWLPKSPLIIVASGVFRWRRSRYAAQEAGDEPS